MDSEEMREGWHRLTDAPVEDLEVALARDVAELSGKHELKFFVGCDSQVHGGRIVYAKVIAVRMVGVGVRCYYRREWVERGSMPERDRLWNETYKMVEVAQWLETVIEPMGYLVEELHADLNPSPEHLSNCVVGMCLGYIRAMGFTGKIKPECWAAAAADSKTG